MPFFLFILIPFSFLFPFPKPIILFQTETSLSSTPNMSITDFLRWLSPCSPSLPSSCMSSVSTTLLLPSPICPFAPPPSCIRGLSFLGYPSSILFSLSHAVHRKQRLFSYNVQQHWLDAFQCSSSHYTTDFNWYEKHFYLQKMQNLEHYLIHCSSLHFNSSAPSISLELPGLPR